MRRSFFAGIARDSVAGAVVEDEAVAIGRDDTARKVSRAARGGHLLRVLGGRRRRTSLLGAVVAVGTALLAAPAGAAEWMPAADDPQIRNVGAPLEAQADVRDSLAVAWRAHAGRLPPCAGRGSPRVFPADLTPTEIGGPVLGRAPSPGCGIFLDRSFLATATRAQLCWVIVHEWGHNAGLEHGTNLAMARLMPQAVPERHVCFDLPHYEPAPGAAVPRLHSAVRPQMGKGTQPRRRGRPRIAR